MRKICFAFIISIYGLLTSCDPVHSVGFINDSKETIVVDAFITDHFNIQPGMVLTLTPGLDSTWARFVILPGDTVICGQTIAEIDDEMPFTKLNVYYSNDTLSFKSESEIKELYGHFYFPGNPYMVKLE